MPFLMLSEPKGTNLRRTILCYAAMSSHAASGIWFAIAYGTYFMQIAGVTQPFLYTIMNLCIGIFSTLVGMYVIRDMFGRRFLFWGSSVGCGLSMAIIGIGGAVKTSQNSKDVGKALIAGVAIFTFFYNVGIGTVSYPVGTEVVSTRLRTWTVGTAISLGYVLAWFVSFFTPYFINPKKLNWVSKFSTRGSCVPADCMDRASSTAGSGPGPISSVPFSSTSSFLKRKAERLKNWMSCSKIVCQ